MARVEWSEWNENMRKGYQSACGDVRWGTFGREGVGKIRVSMSLLREMRNAAMT